ncbi:MAG: hypothetical protein NTW99_05480 [Chloroflexi bacterium]|nr:hypothetical protein [Chloroflexota bacterium]
MNTRKISLLVGVFALALAVLACTMNIGGPDYPTPAIPVSTEAVGELQSSLETAVAAGAVSGQITLTFTEPQLTSYLYNKLQAQSQPLITNPQVYLRDGQLQVYGTASKSYFKATARIILSAGVDDQGQLKIELTSADFGPLPVPNGLKEIITTIIQEAYTGALGPVATGFQLQSVTIADGMMTIVGQTK